MTPDLDSRLRAVIRQRREAKQLSVSDAAERSGIGRTYWHKVESGHRSPGVEVLAKIASALGCRASALLRAAEG